MKNRERIQARYLRDALPLRLAGLAADLGRVASSARHETGGAAAGSLLDGGAYFIVWTVARAAVELAAELVDLQALLALWRRTWPEAQQIPLLRSLLAAQAKQWADQVMRHVAEDVR